MGGELYYDQGDCSDSAQYDGVAYYHVQDVPGIGRDDTVIGGNEEVRANPEGRYQVVSPIKFL